MIFGLQYSNRERWLTRRNLLLLGLQPLAALLMVWTNEMHGLFRAEVLLDTSGDFAVLGVRLGMGFWFHAVYSYLLLLGTLTLVRNFMRASHLHRGQVNAVLLGALAPWLGNALYLSGASPFPHLDLTPFAFTLTGLFVTLGLFRFHFLDVTPIARDAIFEGIEDGIIVLDKEDRIVDINPAAQDLIRRPASALVGHAAAHALSHLPVLVARIGEGPQDRVEILLGETGNRGKYELRISPLHDRGGTWWTGSSFCTIPLRPTPGRRPQPKKQTTYKINSAPSYLTQCPGQPLRPALLSPTAVASPD